MTTLITPRERQGGRGGIGARHPLLVIVTLLAAFLLPAHLAQAAGAIDTVQNCNSSGAGSLPAVVAAANAGDTVNFAVDCPSTAPITLTSWITTTATPLTIDGSGHQIDIDGGGTTSAFHVPSGNTLTLRDLTISNAGGTVLSGECTNLQSNCTLHAPAVYSEGTLTVTGCTFRGDSGHEAVSSSGQVTDTAYGAAIATSLGSDVGPLTVNTSYFVDNVSAVSVIYSRASSTTITSSTFDSNGSGPTSINNNGGIGFTVWLEGFNGSFTNDTFVHNTDSYTVSTLYGVTVIASTFDGNIDSGAFASQAGGATVSIGSSILNAGCPREGGANINDLGYNLAASGDWFVNCGFTEGKGDVYVSPAALGLAGAAADNGGAVPTDAVEPGSPAIGMVPVGPLCPATDARGYLRPGAGETNCTAGAFEYNGELPTTTTSLTSSANPSVYAQAVTFTAQVTALRGTPTGTVQFAIDGTNFGSPVSLNSSGQATSPSVSSLSVGSHTITATYSGDATYTGSSGNLTQTVQQAPAITTASSTTFTVGTPGSFTVTATGFPHPSLTESGNLPAGVSFHDNGNGTATLSGTPAAGTAGTYPLILTASNGVGSPATQSFTLTVNQGSAITSASSTTFTVGSAGSFTVTATGSPTPSLSESGNLPAGVTFHDNGNGTATLSGTPAAGTGGTYPLILTASNGVGAPATQSFTLTVNQAPAITSGSSTTFQVGAPGAFTVTSSGFPTPSLSESGALPAGVSFHDNGNGTASLSGTPGAGTAGVYHLTITASNGVGSPATQSFTLTVIANTNTTLISSANPSSLHQSVTFTAAVTSAGGVPTGSVTFQVDGVSVATVALDSSGHASFTTSSLGVGTHTITAIYSGSSLFPGSSASLTQRVGYTICPIQLPFQGVTSGHIKIKLQLCDASGADLSSPNIILTVVGVSPNPGVAPPSGTFSFIPLLGGTNGGYQYSVDTTGYRIGTYNLLFTVAGDPVTHQIQFTVT